MAKYKVEAVVDRRKRKGVTEYKVKWKGFDESDNTWETEQDIVDQGWQDKIDAYKGSQGSSNSRRSRSRSKSRTRKTSTPKKTTSRSKTPLRRSTRKKKKVSLYSPSEANGLSYQKTVEEESKKVSSRVAEYVDDAEEEQEEDESSKHATIVESGNRDVVQWTDIWSASQLLTALFGGIMYIAFDYTIMKSKKGLQMKEESPNMMFALMLILRTLPSFVACYAVRSVNDNIKNFNQATYLTFIDIGLIWCVASDVIECVAEDEDYQKMCYCGMAIVAHLSLIIAFTSESSNVNELPPMQLSMAVFFMSIATILVHMLSDGDILQGIQDNPEIVALIVSFSATMWRAAARVGYGHDTIHAYASLPQWIGLLGSISLAFSQLIYIGEADKINFVGVDRADLKIARLTCYWIAIGSIAASALMAGSERD